MNAVSFCGQTVAWGIRPEWTEATVVNVPIGQAVVRRKVRNREAVKVYTRSTSGELSEHLVEPLADGTLKLLWPRATNKREVEA
jgi:hypothetical protein